MDSKFSRGRYQPANDHWRSQGQAEDSVSRPEEMLLDVGDVGKASHTRTSGGILSILSWWRAEFIATLLSLVSIIAMIIILRYYDGRPSAQLGLPYRLTLNGVIAAIATAIKAFLMVPVASAMAQELWLYYADEAQKQKCTSRLRTMNTFDAASRGAWGSIVFLFRFRGQSAFAQQMISYDRAIPLQVGVPLSPANLPRSEYWDAFWGILDEANAILPLQMIAAINSGVISSDVTPVLATCLTGTWPLTPSLAVSGGCVKSSYTNRTCFQQGQVQPMCNYTLPSGSVASLYDLESSPESTDYSGAPIFASIPNNSGAYYNVTKAEHIYISNFDLFGASYEHSNSDNKSISTPVSFECALWMCVQTYNTSIVNTKQVQTVTAVTDATMTDTIEYWLNLPPLVNFTFPPVPLSADPHSVTSFKALTGAVLALYSYLFSALDGTVMGGAGAMSNSNELVLGIWNGTTDIDAWISNLATSMTNVVRTMNSTSRAEYNGIGYTPGVTVRWAWIALPLTLVLLSILLLILAIIRTERSSVRPWKSEPLTFLLFDVDAQVRTAVAGGADQPRGIERAIGQTAVRLSDTPRRRRKFQRC